MIYVLKTTSRRIIQSLNQLISYLPLCIVTCFTVPIYPILKYGFYGGNLSLYDCVSWVESRLPYVSFKHLNPLSKAAAINLTSLILEVFMNALAFLLIMGIPSIIAMTYSVAICAVFVVPSFFSIHLFFNLALKDDQTHDYTLFYILLILSPPAWTELLFAWVILNTIGIVKHERGLSYHAPLSLVRQKLSFLDKIYTSIPNKEMQFWLFGLIEEHISNENHLVNNEDLEKISRLKIVKQSRSISLLFFYNIQKLCSSGKIETHINEATRSLVFMHKNEVCLIPDEFFRKINLPQPYIHKTFLSETMKVNIHAAIIDKSPDSFVGPITTELKKIISKHPNLAHQATLNLAQLLYISNQQEKNSSLFHEFLAKDMPAHIIDKNQVIESLFQGYRYETGNHPRNKSILYTLLKSTTLGTRSQVWTYVLGSSKFTLVLDRLKKFINDEAKFNEAFNYSNDSGSLLHAAMHDYIFKIKERANTEINDHDQASALDIEIEKTIELIKLLTNNGIDQNLTDRNGLKAGDWIQTIHNKPARRKIAQLLNTKRLNDGRSLQESSNVQKFLFNEDEQNTHNSLVNSFYAKIITKLTERYPFDGLELSFNDFVTNMSQYASHSSINEIQQKQKHFLDLMSLEEEGNIYIDQQNSMHISRVIDLLVKTANDPTVTESTVEERKKWLYQRSVDIQRLCPTGYTHELIQSLELKHPDIGQFQAHELTLLQEVLIDSLISSIGSNPQGIMSNFHRHSATLSSDNSFTQRVKNNMEQLLVQRGYFAIATKKQKLQQYISTIEYLDQETIDRRLEILYPKSPAKKPSHQLDPCPSVVDICVLICSFYLTLTAQHYAVFILANLITLTCIYDLTEYIKTDNSNFQSFFRLDCLQFAQLKLRTAHQFILQRISNHSWLENLKLFGKESIHHWPIIISCSPHIKASSFLVNASIKAIKPFIPVISSSLQGQYSTQTEKIDNKQ